MNNSEVCAERQLQQRPDNEFVARRSNCLAVLHTTYRAPASSYKHHAKPLYRTQNSRQQQTSLENRLLHAAVEILNATVKAAQTLLLI